MNVEHLSDHVGELMDQAQQRLRLLEDEKSYWSAESAEAERGIADARRRRSFWRWLIKAPSREEPRFRHLILDAEYERSLVAARIKEAAKELGALEGGADGERRFEGELTWMPSQWVMFRGYRNQKGEADAVLVGPDGVWTVEVKNWKSSIRIDGETWTSRNPFDGSPQRAMDRKGRTPAQQVREVAESLETRLHRVGYTVPVRTAVVVLNNHAVIESCRRPGIDFVGTSTSVFADWVTKLATPLADDEVVAIQQLVRNDHQYWKSRFENK